VVGIGLLETEGGPQATNEVLTTIEMPSGRMRSREQLHVLEGSKQPGTIHDGWPNREHLETKNIITRVSPISNQISTHAYLQEEEDYVEIFHIYGNMVGKDSIIF